MKKRRKDIYQVLKTLRILFLTVLICAFHGSLIAQCTPTISTYPYNESFETSQGGWVSGGTGDDWAWGTPSKPIISSAGTGSKCWITGGLSTSFYTNGERSWVQSPCFDFSLLAHPYVSFKIFWETEQQYDGCTFQYSLNGGSTWTNVGTNTDPINCISDHWFNHGSITNLATLASIRQGWSGTTLSTSGSCQGGGGSGAWLLAKHCMSYLAGEPSVMFRFAFGAGTTCNSYDGVAFDDITIREAPAVTPAFTFSCAGTNTISFTDLSGTCPNNWSWNFNDPASGAGNVVTTQNPIHTFSGPGSYSVTLSASNSCSAIAFATQDVNIINAVATPDNVSCYGANDGSATIQVLGNASPYTYDWNTVPAQTGPVATGLQPGTYTFIVTGNNTCSDTNTVTISQPLQFVHSVAVIPAHCGQDNGVATESITGGTQPYHYSWSSGSGNVSTATNLAPGGYSVAVTDTEGCSFTDHFIVGQSPALTLFSNALVAACGLSNGSVVATPQGGTSPFTFNWAPNVSSTMVANNLSGGNYIITVTDSLGCIAQDTATVIQQPGISFTVAANPDTCSRGLGSARVNIFTGTPPFSYSWAPGNYTSQLITNLNKGSYAVTVTDSNGCSDNKTVHVDDFGKFKVNLGEDATICTGNELELSVGNYASYQWQDNSQLPTLTINQPGTYWVTVKSNLGCSSTDTIHVIEECLDDVIAPNAFSPNGDGKNELFYATGLNVTSFDMEIYNRWGEKVFASNDMNEPWNGLYEGRLQEFDIYVWIMNFTIGTKESQRKVGRVLLIR